MVFLKRIGFFCAFIIPAVTVSGYLIGGLLNWATVVFVFALIPILDQIVGKDPYNIPDTEIRTEGRKRYYRFILFTWVYVQYALIIWGAWVVFSGQLSNWAAYAGFTISIGLSTGGVGITVAHELGHKHGKLEKLYAKLLLMSVCYMHFYIEHNRGHHVHVATPQDAATARHGEPLYAFWLRSVTGCYRHAWKLENHRLRKKGRHILHIQNEMIWFTLLPILLCFLLTTGISLLAGRFTWEVIPYFFTQSLVAFTLLEAVNYIEHYGLERRETETGRFERVQNIHSWNANHLISNFFLFQLQRHSDHHVHATRPYQVLQHFDESPQLPTGYAGMIVLAFFPPLWFSLMNKRLNTWKEQRLQRGNVSRA
ncbi:alkane 1-monooxygenase [Roseivirga sp. BDSF3-8]|uniref:alkane 1-monooxygenase n=1 Tax=Roseivirga sp. BDSF3-8 TaxID=3241598 RepID=UPI0035326F5B